jgi:hypothetical protein
LILMQWPAITWHRAAACIALLASGLAHAARDVAWIWPGSDMPSGPLQEVAVLVESIEFRGTDLARRPRLRSLVLAPTVEVTPVIHVQSDARSPDSFSAAQREAVLAALSRHAHESSSGWIQLDFEAPARQREAPDHNSQFDGCGGTIGRLDTNTMTLPDSERHCVAHAGRSSFARKRF